MTSVRGLYVGALLSIFTAACLDSPPPKIAAQIDPQYAADPVLAPLPSEREGAFPIMQPEYAGVEQLLVLSDRWIVVVTDNVPAIVAQVDALSKGEYSKTVDRQALRERVKGESQDNYSSRARPIWDQFAAKAREAAGERDWGKPESYAIQSDGDENYHDTKAPASASCVPVGVGGPRFRGAPDWYFLHYAYLRLPSPLKSGERYSVTLKDGRAVSFVYDEMRTVSRAIKVNQVGYLPDVSHKYAYIGVHLYGTGPLTIPPDSRFKVIDVITEDAVLEGAVALRSEDITIKGKDGAPDVAAYGETIYEIDLSELKTEGTFFISVPGVGRSWPFSNGKPAYGEAFYIAARGLYHQRCGTAYEGPYTKWKRARCHTDPVYESDFINFGIGEFDAPKKLQRFDIIAATTDTSRKTENVVGGWHDAADWDRGSMHYTDIYDLLYAYEMRPGAFTDGQLNIPESGNGIPDVLDEAEFGLAVWTKSMTPEGGVSGAVETWTHPPMDAKVDYTFSRRTRWDSLNYAAAAAQLALHLRDLDPTRSARYRELAERAFEFGSDPANALGRVEMNAKTNRGKGEPYSVNWEEKEEYVRPYLLHAKARLFLLTSDQKYRDGIEQLAAECPPPYAYPYSYRDFSPWLWFALARNEPKLISDTGAREIRDRCFLRPANDLVEQSESNPYRCSWKRDQNYFMAWGNSVMTNYSRALLIAHALTGDVRYRDVAALNADFMLGANPMGMCWTTGLGYVYPIEIQHAVSELDGVLDPVPGITLYGITGGVSRGLRESVWTAPGPEDPKSRVSFFDQEVPVWRQWSSHPHLNVNQCEFTVSETISSTIFTSAMLIADGWTPSETLKQRGPRRADLLFGYWYLP